MTKRLVISPRARGDLRAIAKHIAERNPVRARTFIAELKTKAEQIALRPRSFRLRLDISKGLRSAVYGTYLLLFRELENEVRISRIVHGARDLGEVTFD